MEGKNAKNAIDLPRSFCQTPCAARKYGKKGKKDLFLSLHVDTQGEGPKNSGSALGEFQREKPDGQQSRA